MRGRVIVVRVIQVAIAGGGVLALIAVIDLLAFRVRPNPLLGAIAVILEAVVGPFVWLAWGPQGAVAALVAIVMIAICLVLSRYLLRRYPDSELFVAPAAIAVVLWAVSGWLAVAATA